MHSVAAHRHPLPRYLRASTRCLVTPVEGEGAKLQPRARRTYYTAGTHADVSCRSRDSWVASPRVEAVSPLPRHLTPGARACSGYRGAPVSTAGVPQPSTVG